MIIQCTSALMEKIDSKITVIEASDKNDMNPLIFWHAHFIKVNRKNAIVLINDLTSYTVVLFRPKKKDFLDLERQIEIAIRYTLKNDGYLESVIDEYFNASPSILFTKWSSRSVLGRFQMMKRIIGYNEYLDPSTLQQRFIGAQINSYISRMKDGQDSSAQERMQEELLQFLSYSGAENGVIQIFKHYELKIRLDLDYCKIYRRVSVPSYYTFRQLSNVILTVFDWLDYHIHEFIVEQKEGMKLILQMDDDPDRLLDSEMANMELKLEQFVSIDEVFSKEPILISYIYDLGDYWEHEIILEKITEREERLPIYLEGKGERPPEDVGGSGGFEEYLEIIADKDHPEHEFMVDWASPLRERKRSEEEINRALSSSLYLHSRY